MQLHQLHLVSAGATFTYGQVERALARVHEVAPKAMGAFKGRIKKLQEQKIVPAAPGKGQRILYRALDVYLWGYCLELSEFGMDPKIIRVFVDLTWAPASWKGQLKVSAAMSAGAPGNEDEDQVLLFDPNLLSRWYIVDGMQAGKVEAAIHPASVLARDPLKLLKYRQGLLNLTELRRRIDRELATTQKEWLGSSAAVDCKSRISGQARTAPFGTTIG